MTSLLGITLFVLALMLAIFLHEGGHFATAKLFGMKVERFFLGFGPTLWSFRRGETEYGVKAFPLGGFCKIAGMSPYESDGNFLEEDRSAKQRPGAGEGEAGGAVASPPRPASTPTEPSRQFRNKPAWQRAIVLAAGSFTHFIVAILLTWVVLAGLGIEQATTTIERTVSTTNAGDPAPAQAAGLRGGDRIVAIDGRPVDSFDELRAALDDKGDQQIKVTYVRDGREQTTSLTAASQDGRGFLGFEPQVQVQRQNVLAAIPESAHLFWNTTVATVKGLGGFVTGLAHRLNAPEPVPGAAGGGGDGGPIGIVGITRLAGQAVANNQWAIFIAILIQLNIVVGVFNLLPLPPMDGGYLAFLLWQVVTRREVDLRKVVPVAALIVGLLVMLTVGLVWLDITNPVPYPFR
ncbi:MAG TPA: M50 family metallopeptidase [Actinomycetes bacterium]|jgi:membrane-associated protease RseP (regulator of RpoE activity)|nr:M50 family metallopeptidase [Actinomycetes bacterium]